MTTGPRPPRKRAPAKKVPAKKPALAEVTPLPVAEIERPLLAVLNDAVAQMDWLKASDEAMVELCREYARRIDQTKEQAEEFADVAFQLRELVSGNENDFKSLMARLYALEKAVDLTKVAAWVGPHLANALRDLGGAPAERKGLSADAPVQNRLQELRGKAEGRRPARSR